MGRLFMYRQILLVAVGMMGHSFGQAFGNGPEPMQPIGGSAQVVAAIESGPVLLELTLVNRSETAQKFYSYEDELRCTDLPRDWRRKGTSDLALQRSEPSKASRALLS
jgi:hypothetical protein